MRKFKFLSFLLLLALGSVIVVFNSCGNSPKKEGDPNSPTTDSGVVSSGNNPKESGDLNNPTTDSGVVINDVKWATCNVAAPGTFAAKPENAGMIYQWNCKKAWVGTGNITDWEGNKPDGTTWEKANDPCPAGWRVPTLEEIKKLVDSDKVTKEWTTLNGVQGRKFTDKTSGNSIFLPAVGCRVGSSGKFDDDEGTIRYYLSSTLYTGNDLNVYILYFNSDVAYDMDYRLVFGYSIRPVAE